MDTTKSEHALSLPDDQIMASFTPPRDRDAWGTIRGYVYQVDLTIERWLGLQPGQIIELECGEDIDLVSRSLMATPEKEQRLLEQVKHLDKSITLRTPSVIATIACAIEHRGANPSVDLYFRYTTNAQVISERPSPMKDRIPAISVWEQIREKQLDKSARSAALENILIILRNARQPEGIPDDTWVIFQNFVTGTSQEQLLELVRCFEWSTGAPEACALGPHIQRLLTNQRFAENEQQATEQYQRLFLYVFKLLSQPGSKQLTAEALEYQLSLPTLDEKDRELLDKVVARTCILEARVGQLEQVTEYLDAQFQRMAQAQGIDAAIDYTVATPDLDIPPLVAHLSRREETVSTLKEICNSHTWVAIHGSVGSGKTQLVVLLAQALGTCRAWVRLRGLTVEQAYVRLDAVCKVLVETPLQSNLYNWYCQLCERLGSHAMIVLDDLPRISSGDELSGRLVQLARACNLYGVTLLSTSPYPLPASFRESFDDQTLYTMASPLFSILETSEMLSDYEAPGSLFTPELVVTINALGKQHPLLIAVIVQYLRQKNWPSPKNAIGELFKSKYTSELDDETIGRLLVTIEDEQSRELLYRLSLIFGSFARDDVRAIASVDPVVERPRERLYALIGPWVQYDTDERLLICPLIGSIGRDNLDPETQKACHSMLGDRIVRKGKLDLLDVWYALIHFCNAEEFNRAGVILILALSEMNNLDGPVRDIGLLSLWSNQPLPSQMDLDIRLYLRGLQIAVRHKLGRQTAYLVEDLDSLIGQASEKEAWSVLAATIAVNLILAQSDPIRAHRYALAALRLLPHIQTPDGGGLTFPDGSELVFPDEMRLEYLIWSSIMDITTQDHLRDWINAVEQLTLEQQQRAFTGKMAELNCMQVSNRLLLVEADKPKENQRWDKVLDALYELAERACQLNLELLWACAVRAQTIVLAEYHNDLKAAVAAAEAAIAEASDDSHVQFLIRECVGQQYVYTNQNDKALIWLNQALAQPTNAYPKVHLHALLSASRAAGASEPNGALQYAQQAVSLARASEDIPEMELVKALGELTIAQWLANDLLTAFKSWNEAGERLFACRMETDDWKDLFVIYDHTSGYLSSLAYYDSPPTELQDGEPYTAPYRGIFLTYQPKRTTSYNKMRECFVMAQLTMFAEAAGNDERAAMWSSRGLDLARAANQRLVFSSLSLSAIPHLLQDDHYAQVLDFALEGGAILVALTEQRRASEDLLRPDLDIEAILGQKPNKLWQKAEHNAALAGLLPTAFRISTVMLGQPERARLYAAEVASLCRQISATAADQQLWTTAAELFEQIFIQKVPGNELIRYSNTLGSQDYAALQRIGYLGATLQDDATLENAWLGHLAVMLFVSEHFKPLSSTYRRVILPFISEYWTTRFDKMRFRFSSPRMVRASLSKVQDIPEDQRAQSILKAVALGLKVSPPPEAEQWLHSYP